MSEFTVYMLQVFRVSNFETQSVFAVILALLGAPWYVWLPFILVVDAALLVTFPTERRWSTWQAPRQ